MREFFEIVGVIILSILMVAVGLVAAVLISFLSVFAALVVSLLCLAASPILVPVWLVWKKWIDPPEIVNKIHPEKPWPAPPEPPKRPECKS